MRGDLTVAEAADALGTSAQTVRTLLRKGELLGRKQAWGARYVWVVSQDGLDTFLAEFGRLDGRRRHPVALTPGVTPRTAAAEPPLPVAPLESDAATDGSGAWPRRRPFILRPRGRATVVVVLLGVPLALVYAASRILPEYLWFDELGQAEVYRDVVTAKVQWYALVAGTVATLIGLNLGMAFRRTDAARTRGGVLSITAASLVTGSLFASSAMHHWQTFVLARHARPFRAD
jgi:uncharacterized protein